MQINVSLKKKTYVTKKWQTTVNKHDKRARTPQDLYINSCKRTTCSVIQSGTQLNWTLSYFTQTGVAYDENTCTEAKFQQT